MKYWQPFTSNCVEVESSPKAFLALHVNVLPESCLLILRMVNMETVSSITSTLILLPLLLPPFLLDWITFWPFLAHSNKIGIEPAINVLQTMTWLLPSDTSILLFNANNLGLCVSVNERSYSYYLVKKNIGQIYKIPW